MTKKSLYNLFILLIFISQFILINLQEESDSAETNTLVIDAIVSNLKSKKTDSKTDYLYSIKNNGVYSYTSTNNDNYHYQISYVDK